MQEKMILVTTPQTTNGSIPAIDQDTGKLITKTTILAATARKHLEAINKTLPDVLKHKIEDYTEEVNPAVKTKA